MTPLNLQARRATVDDLPELRKLWVKSGLPSEALEPRLTEFQIAVTVDGAVLGCAALQIDSQQGLVHSECQASADDAAAIRQRLWERIQSVAKNHGLVRLWRTGGEAFWREAGFTEATEAERERLPAVFGAGEGWLLLKLRDEAAAMISFEREFELFKQTQQGLSAKALQQARVLKLLAWVIGGIAFLLSIVAVLFALKNAKRPRR